MDSSGLQDLPVSLPLGSQLSSGFDPSDPQSFHGFSHSMDHGLPATGTFQSMVQSPRPGNFDPRDNGHARYQIPPLRPIQDVSASNHIGHSQPIQRSSGLPSRSSDVVDELDWIPPLIPTLASPISHQSAPHSQEAVSFLSDAIMENKDSHFGSMKLIPNPPDLNVWRERLFNVDEPIALTEEQFKTYFPHIDNVYSHRSTQKYKRKPFVSYYWDCRLKGRPPGTPKSDDPNKKKRKRTARQRDLCDVKIKIMEFFPGATPADSDLGSSIDVLSTGNPSTAAFFGGRPGQNQSFGILTPNQAFPPGHPGASGQKYYTIQRVNGNGGNGKTDGVEGGHRHTLEESDRVKKNSVHRHMLKLAKEKKETGGQSVGLNNIRHVCHPSHLYYADETWPFFSFSFFIKTLQLRPLPPPRIGYQARSVLTLKQIQTYCATMTDQQQKQTQTKSYHKKATGQAQLTVRNRSKDDELKLFASCFCPFVQRVWIALEMKGISYQYIEVDPYKKPDSLLEVNPRGLVPALRHNNWGCYESNVLLEYLEDLDEGVPLLPPGDAKLRAHCRLWADHINRHVIPLFYRVLMEQDTQKQVTHAGELKDEIAKLVNASHVHGPFFLGPAMSYVDVQIAPWIIRLSRVLKPYRGWPEPEMGTRWANWVQAIEQNEHVMATTSSDDLYLDSYERYSGKSMYSA